MADPTIEEILSGAATQSPGGAAPSIEQILSQAAPAAPTGVARVGSEALQDLGTAGALALGAPGDLESALMRGVNWVGRQAGASAPIAGDPAEGTFFPTSRDMLGVTNALGITGRIAPEQMGTAARYVNNAITGGLAAVPYALTGGVGGLVPRLAEYGASGAAGATAATAAGDAGAGPTGQALAALAAGGAVTGIGENVRGTLAASAADRGVSQAQAALAQAQADSESARRAGVDLRASHSEAEGQALQQMQAVHSMADQAQAQVRDLHGGPMTVEAAGQAAQDAARQWRQNVFPAAQEAAWAPVDALIPDSTPVGMENFQQTLEKMTAGAGPRVQPFIEDITPGLPRQWMQRLAGQNSEDEAKGQLGELVGGEAPEAEPLPPPTWGDLRQLRSAIGSASGPMRLRSGISDQEFQNLYRSISEDMRAAAGEQSPEAADAFAAANAESQRLHQINDGPLSKVISTVYPAQETIDPGKAAKGVLGLSGRDLATLRQDAPGVLDPVAASVLTPDAAGGLGEAQWGKLSPEAQQYLTQTPELAQTVSQAQALKEGATQHVKQLQLTNKAEWDSQIPSAQETARRAQFEAQRQLSAAQAAAAAGAPNPLLQSLTGVRAQLLGTPLGEALGSALPLGHFGPLIGTGVGLLGPPLARAAAGFVKHPVRLGIPASMSLVGAPEPSEQ